MVEGFVKKTRIAYLRSIAVPLTFSGNKRSADELRVLVFERPNPPCFVGKQI